MSTEQDELQDIERVAGLVDARTVDLDDHDRTVLHGIFARAGAVAGGEAEVSGFGAPGSGEIGAANPNAQGLFQSFSWGMGLGGNSNTRYLNPQPLPPG